MHKLFTVTILLGHCFFCPAQKTTRLDDLKKGQISPIPLKVTFEKTTHLIFPSNIRYVDLGSTLLIAGKADNAENVLRIKATVEGFDPETNFSVITDDGKFYNFNVTYSPSPEILNIDMEKLQKEHSKKSNPEAHFTELGNNSPAFTELLLKTIYSKDQRLIKHIGSKRYGLIFSLKGVYAHNGKFYFHIELKNGTHVPFHIDFMSFTVIDKKTDKRTPVQERALSPIKTYPPLGTVKEKNTGHNVFLFDQLTLADGKVLEIRVYEKNGSRHLSLKIENTDLMNAESIKGMQLKF